MSLITFALYLLIGIAIAALAAWALQAIPGDATIKQIGRVVVIVLVCLWVIAVVAQFFGLATPFPHQRL